MLYWEMVNIWHSQTELTQSKHGWSAQIWALKVTIS